MADLDLTNTYRTDDHAEEYARRNLDQEWAAYLNRQRAAGAAGEPTTEVRGAPGAEPAAEPEAPPPAPAPTLQTSSFTAAVDAMFAAAREGVTTALKPGPLSVASAKEVFDGLMQTVFSPIAGLAAGVGQSVENLAPELAEKEFLPGGVNGPAFTLRHLAMGAPDVKTLSPEQMTALSAPMTAREAVEFAVQQVPFVAPAARKGAAAVRQQIPNILSERGAVELGGGAEFRGTKAPGEAARPEPAAPAGPTPPLVPPEGAQARINVARQAGPESAKQVMLDISKIISERPEVKESRRTVGHAETIAEADTWKLADLLNVTPGDLKLSDVRGFQLAARDHFNAATRHIDDLAKRIKSGDPAAEAQWAAAEVVLERLAMLAELPGTELARALESRKIEATVERVAGYTPDVVARLAAMRAGTDVPPAVAAAQYLALPTQAQRQAWLKQKWQAAVRGKDIAHELWINSLLTNPQTHAANVAGTGLSIAWNIPETWAAELINTLFTRDGAGVQRGEAASMLRAIPQGLSDAMRLSKKVTAKELGREVTFTGVEEALIGQGRVEVDQQLPSVLRIPTLALGIEDAAGKALSYRMELSALALRQARTEGKIGPALEARVKELETNPPGPMIAEATDAAMLRTLNAELGPAGQTFMKWANQVPGGRLVLPFIRTPTNAAKWFGQRAPILGQLSQQNWRDITAGGAARDKALARQAIGMAVSAVLMYEVVQGNITGGGDPDRNLKSVERVERPPYSIKVGNTWYSYNRLDPVGGLIGLVADYAEITGRIPTQGDLEHWAAYSEGIGLAVGHTMVNKTYMRGLADVLDAMKDPQRNVGTVASGWARSIVPAGLRSVTRQMDDNILRDARSLLDQIKTGIPYWAEDVPPARNPITGEPVRFPPGWGPDLLSPIYITAKRNDPVLTEIITNHISLAPVPRYVGPGERQEGPMLQEPRGGQRAIQLTPKQHDYWIWAMTHEKQNGMTLHEALTALVTSDRYQTLSPGAGGSREYMVSAIYKAYMDAGQMALRRESPTIDAKLREAYEERGRRMLPVTDPRSPHYGKTPAFGR